MIIFTNTDKIAPALVKAIGELTDPHKAGKVAAGQRRYTYLMLPDLLGEVRRVFAANALAVLQSVEVSEGGVHVTTTVIHESGQTLTTAPLSLRTAADAQSVGSAVTYGRRYALAALVGLAGSDDDDGERAARAVPELTRPVERIAQRASDPDPWAQPRPAVDAHTQEMAGRTPPPDTDADEPPLPPHGYPQVYRPDDSASQKQLGAIRGICQTLGVGNLKAADFSRWILKKDHPNRPDDLLLTKGEASKVIEALQGDNGKALAAEWLQVLT